MLIRCTPAARMTSSRSRVTVSGRPASTVYSIRCERSKFCSMVLKMRPKSCADNVVGVPPPNYTVASSNPNSLAYLEVSSSSRSNRST